MGTGVRCGKHMAFRVGSHQVSALKNCTRKKGKGGGPHDKKRHQAVATEGWAREQGSRKRQQEERDRTKNRGEKRENDARRHSFLHFNKEKSQLKEAQSCRFISDVILCFPIEVTMRSLNQCTFSGNQSQHTTKKNRVHNPFRIAISF